ncbi:protein TRANPARENT TESTA 12-like, partial [Trifolium pratense]
MESHFDDHEIHQPLISTHDQSPPPSPPPPELNSRLEEVLSNKQLPLLKRFLSATWIELKFLFPLAGPTIIVYVINNLMSTVTRAVAGHLGNLQLAAANLGNSGVQLFAYGLM